MIDPTTASTTLSSPTCVQPEDTPSHIATLSTAELDAECIEVDHYLATFSHLARAAPEPQREIERRGRRADAADGLLAQRSPGRSMDNGQFPRPPGVRYGPRERPSKSGPCKNLKGQVSSAKDNGLNKYGIIPQPDSMVVFTAVLSGNNTNVNTTAERAALPIDYPPSLTYTAPVGHTLRPVRPLPPLPPVPPVCNSAGYQRHPQVAGCEGDVDGQGRKGDRAEEQLKRACGDKEGQSDNGSKTGRQSGKATKEEEGERMDGFTGNLVLCSEPSSEDRIEAWRHAVAEAGAEGPDDASRAVNASTADGITEEVPRCHARLRRLAPLPSPASRPSDPSDMPWASWSSVMSRGSWM